MTNADQVRAMYAAFQRGDVAPIIQAMAPDVRWDDPAQNTDAPWLQPRRGPDGVAAFFASLAAIEFHRFEVKTVLEQANLVVGIVIVEATVKATGVRVDEADEVHLWTFNELGKVTEFKHRLDTRQHQLAFTGARVAELA